MKILEFIKCHRKIYSLPLLIVDSKTTEDLRKFPAAELYKFPNATVDSWLCSGCRKRINSYVPPAPAGSSEEFSQEHISQKSNASVSECAETIDKILKISPVKRKW